MALLRAIASEGHLYSYEIREDFGEMAQQNHCKIFRAGTELDPENRGHSDGIA